MSLRFTKMVHKYHKGNVVFLLLNALFGNSFDFAILRILCIRLLLVMFQNMLPCPCL